MDAQLAQARVELEWGRNQALPGLDLAVIGSQDLGPGSSTRTPPELEAGVAIEIPIQTRSLEGRIGLAEAQVARLEIQARFVRDRVHADVRDTWNALSVARERTRVARLELDVARELERAERERFRIGEGNQFMVNVREQATLEAALREVDSRSDQLKAMASLETAMGQVPG